MFRLIRRYGGKLPIIGDMVFSILIFTSSFALLEKWVQNLESIENPIIVDNPAINLTVQVAALYGTLALVHLFRSLRMRLKSHSMFVAHLVYGASFAICTAAVLILGYNEITRTVLSLVFWGCLVANRVLAIIRKRTPWNILSNVVLMLAFLLVSVTSFLEYAMLFVSITASFASLVAILVVAFLQIRFDILKDILQKTYALEIICSLLLSMIAFSYILEFADDSFESFWDALWYCFAVVTTIGFGDIAPSGIVGRILSAILGIYGIIVVALITSVIVNFYGEMKRVDTKKPVEAAPAPDGDEPDGESET